MGIFSRLKTLISSNVNDLINKAENPEKMLNQLLIDMNTQLIESKKAVAMAIADEKKLERETANQQSQAQEWEKKAMLAVRSGKDDLAREALLRKRSTKTPRWSTTNSGKPSWRRWTSSRPACGNCRIRLTMPSGRRTSS
jgi:phage shock protein A